MPQGKGSIKGVSEGPLPYASSTPPPPPEARKPEIVSQTLPSGVPFLPTLLLRPSNSLSISPTPSPLPSKATNNGWSGLLQPEVSRLVRLDEAPAMLPARGVPGPRLKYLHMSHAGAGPINTSETRWAEVMGGEGWGNDGGGKGASVSRDGEAGRNIQQKEMGRIRIKKSLEREIQFWKKIKRGKHFGKRKGEEEKDSRKRERRRKLGW